MTGTALPASIRSYYDERAATRDNREAVAAVRKRFAANPGRIAEMREFMLSDLHRAVQEHSAAEEYQAGREHPDSDI